MTYIIVPAAVGPWVDSDEVFTDSALDGLVSALHPEGILTYAEVLGAHAGLLDRYLAKVKQVSVLTYSRANGWIPTTVTGEQDAKRALDIVHGQLHVPNGLTLWDDVEGPSQSVSFTAIIEHVDAHAAAISAARDTPGPYIGWGTMLTSAEWQSRPNDHGYYKAGGITRDRFGNAVEPNRGWQFIQGLPFNQQPAPGVVVDLDFAVQDQRGSRAMVIQRAA